MTTIFDFEAAPVPGIYSLTPAQIMDMVGMPLSVQDQPVHSKGRPAYRHKVISLSGYAQTGKDTVARFLMDEGYERIAFADDLRQDLYTLNPAINVGLGKFYPLQEIVDLVGWDEAKVRFPEVRRLQQVYGTEVGRDRVAEDIWIQRAFRKIAEGGKFVFTDTRFPDEADALRGIGATLVRIHRPGVGPVNGHRSDNQLDSIEYDVEIHNDGTLDELRLKALALL